MDFEKCIVRVEFLHNNSSMLFISDIIRLRYAARVFSYNASAFMPRYSSEPEAGVAIVQEHVAICDCYTDMGFVALITKLLQSKYQASQHSLVVLPSVYFSEQLQTEIDLLHTPVQD